MKASSPPVAVRVVSTPTGSDEAAASCASKSDHFVQFYQRDDFLVSSVGRFVAEALRSGASAVVIATPAHRAGVARFLEAAGLSPDSFIESGRYVPLDAAETLSGLMVEGVPNAQRFDQQLGSLVRKLTANGGRLSAFGEMVALLWAEGKTQAAVQLEDLWNVLGESHIFSLFCAYPMRGFATDSNGRPFLHVCKAHTRVLPAEDFESQGVDDEQLRAIAILQQKAEALTGQIAERKRIEATLRRREEELRAFVDSAPIGMHWVDADGVILWSNQAEMDLLGYKSSEYVGHRLEEFHADPLVIQDILTRLRRGETLRNHKARLRCRDGAIKTVAIDSSVLRDQGRFVHTQCFSRDITGQLEAEYNGQHLAAIVASSDDAIVSKSLDGVVESWNAGAQRIFGYAAEEMVGQPITMLIPRDRLSEEVDILSRLRRGERIDHFETVRRRKDGTLINVSVTVSPVKDSTGRIIGASKIARDITEKKRADAALEESRRALARANEELEMRVQQRTASLREAVAQMEEFSYTVSHDLRAPLRGMQVYSNALLEDYGESLDAPARHGLRRIADNAHRLDKMVADVLTFSRISRDEIRLERIALNQLVRDLVQHYPNLQPPHVHLEICELHDVIGHEPSLIQIVSNLLGNAVKFVAPGVTPRVQVWTELSPTGVRLWVKDNGIGIKPEQQGRLFRMFERLHPDLPYEGTGVGLAIVRKAAARMGGEVGVQSDGRTGTTFWIKLSAAEAQS